MARLTAFTLVAALALASSAGAQGLRILPPRIQVTAPAERAVELSGARVSVDVAGALAMTTVEMTFHNPNRRMLEGELQFPLLAGQEVVGFALDVDGRMREAVPVDKARGQEVFEDITRARVDPGLLQVTQGNNYKVRIYPIPAQGQRRVSLRYVETLGIRGNARLYRLPLDYAAGLREFSLEMRVAGDTRPVAAPGPLGALHFDRDGDGWTAVVKRRSPPAGVLELSIPDGGQPRILSQAFGDQVFFHAQARVHASQRARPLPRIVQIVWDASGSMASRDWRAERSLLDAYFTAARNVEVRLVKVRDATEPPARFQVKNGDWSALRQALEATDYDGGTNLAAVSPEREAQEVLVFSDGLANFDEQGLAPGNVPLYAIASTVRAAPAVLRNLAESSGGAFIDLTADSAESARDKLLRATTRIVALDGDGVRDLVTASSIVSDGRFTVAGVLTAPRGVVRATIMQPDGKREIVSLAVIASPREGRLAATSWAMRKVSGLEREYELNRGQIRRLGREFGLATRETSLIVLDRVEDYARYEIDPPRELAESYRALRAQAGTKRDADLRAHLERIVKRFQDKQAWWDRDFPRDELLKEKRGALQEAYSGAVPDRAAPAMAARVLASPASPATSAPARPVEAKIADAGNPSAGTIRLRPWKPDSPYASRMREASSDRVYRVYLDERPDYLQSSAFFLDAADILVEKGQPELAVRVLSNLAEMDLENRALLRILGYRLLQAARPDLAIAVFRKVLTLAPEEPQSYRDLGLAYEAQKQHQKAVGLLCEVVMKPWNARFPDIELIALAELNAIVATAGAPLDTSCLDPRLVRNLPLDLRVVLTWDADNTDIDLWVTDPNGERAFYGHQLTYQGGRMSLDFTGGYGPEEFSLRNAKPGLYKVEANFYGHRQQIVAPATTLQVKLITGFGTARAEERIVTLRLKGASEVVHVGDFEINASRGEGPR